MYLHVLCCEDGGILACRIHETKIENLPELEKLLKHDEQDAGDYFQVIPLQGLDHELLPELESLFLIAGLQSRIGRIADHLLCDLLTVGNKLRNEPHIPR